MNSMYYIILIQHQLERLKRTKCLRVTILMHGLMGLWILSFVLFMAFIAEKQLPINYGNHLLSMGVVPYIFIDLLLRYLFLNTTHFNIYPYLTKNIPKHKLISFAIIQSYATKFNLLSLCLLAGLIHVSGQSLSGNFLLGALILVLIINSVNFLMKQLTNRYTLLHLVYPILLCILLYLSLSSAVNIYFGNKLTNTLFFSTAGKLVLFVIYVALLYLQRKSIEDSLYKIQIKESKRSIRPLQLDFSKNEMLNWIILEGKLILRNAKPRRILISGLFTSLYWIVFKYGSIKLSDPLLILTTVAISSQVSFGYGIFSFSWNWKHNDFILTKPSDPHALFLAKWIVIVLLEILMLILPLLLFIGESLIRNKLIYCAIYILGIPPFITLYAAIIFARKINLDLSGYSANYDGRRIKHIIPELIFILFPVILYLSLKAFNLHPLAFKVIAFVGIAGLLSNNYLYRVILNEARKRRYQIILKFKN